MTEKRRITGMLLTGAVYLAAVLCLAVLVGIIGYVVIKGLPAISWKLITGVPSVTKGTQGILPFLLNTLYMILLTLLISLFEHKNRLQKNNRAGKGSVIKIIF